MKDSVFTKVYVFSYELRKQLLFSVFGYMHHCKHNPTCGRNMHDQILKKGIILGGLSGIWRIMRCW